MKKQFSLPVVGLVLVAAAMGWLLGSFKSMHAEHEAPSTASTADCAGGAKPLYWRAPMDPTFVRDGPGKSPMGMDLVPECPGMGEAIEARGLQIDPSILQSMGVRTTTVARRDLSRAIRAVGRVTVDERRVAHVHSKVQGWVEELHVHSVGQRVSRGDPLLEIYSPELVSTQEEYLLAARYRDATRESSVEDVRRGAASLFEATRRRLELWDIPARELRKLLETGKVERTLTRYAPSSGVVIDLGVRHGMEVQPNDNLYTVADLSSIWVVADIYEHELPWVELGQRGVIVFTSLPGMELESRIAYIAPFLDPLTRTAEVRFELENANGLLKPEMFGSVVIESAIRKDVLAVPMDAVIRSGHRAVAIVALGEGRFEPRDVVLGIDSGDGWVEILRGLADAEGVVVSGQFLIDSESNFREAVKKLLGPTPAESTPAATRPMSNVPGAHP